MADISGITDMYRNKYLKYKKKCKALKKEQSGGARMEPEVEGTRKLVDYSKIKNALNMDGGKREKSKNKVTGIRKLNRHED